MTTATAPIKKGKAKQEVDTANMEIHQNDSFVVPGLDEPMTRPSVIVEVPHGERLQKEYLDELAFQEEELTIVVHHAFGDNPSPWTDYISNNGIPAQVKIHGNWVGFGYFPRGMDVTTKRKFAGELAKSKQEVIQTEIKDRDAERPQNIVHRRLTAKFPFAVVADSNRTGKGEEWLKRLMYQG